jgi:hypothetical protein
MNVGTQIDDARRHKPVSLCKQAQRPKSAVCRKDVQLYTQDVPGTQTFDDGRFTTEVLGYVLRGRWFSSRRLVQRFFDKEPLQATLFLIRI